MRWLRNLLKIESSDRIYDRRICDCRNLLFGILTSLSVKGRKREIGILLSMGEHRKRILGQFVLENLVPVLIALVLRRCVRHQQQSISQIG